MTMMEFDKELAKLQIMFDEQEDGGCERASYTDENHLLKAIIKIGKMSEIIEIRPFASFRWNSGIQGYNKSITFRFLCKHDEKHYRIDLIGTELNDKKFTEFTNGSGLRTSWNSGSADMSRNLKQFLDKNNIDMFLMLTGTSGALLNYKYISPHMLKRSKQTFIIVSDEFTNYYTSEETDLYKVNFKSDGWCATYPYVYNDIVKNNSNQEILDKISSLLDIIREYRSDIGAFSIDIGSKTLKIDNFYTTNGVAADIRNFSSSEILRTIGSFITADHVYNNGRIFINTKVLLTMFRVRKSKYGDDYTLIQTKARNDRTWSPLRLNEGELEDLVTLAEKYNDKDEVAAWRVLAELIE